MSWRQAIDRTVRWSDRLPCCSLRDHEPHQWTGQTYGEPLQCPGAAGGRYRGHVDSEASARADRRLAQENNGITDDWRES